MIISHEHRYIFIELPATGTSAISAELCANYDGERILNKHSTYPTFLAQATPEEKKYFSFSCIRHPMDIAVSQFFKLKTDHFKFEEPHYLADRNLLNRIVYSRRRLDQLRFIRDNDADFASYFLRFFKRPYSNWSVISHDSLDFVIRFEQLNEDLEIALNKMGLDLARPLPIRNKTGDREQNFLDYYPENIRAQAKKVFQPFMLQWGYEFPSDWGKIENSALNNLYYRVLNIGRKFYWTRLKHDL